jgi:hypothetical protein
MFVLFTAILRVSLLVLLHFALSGLSTVGSNGMVGSTQAAFSPPGF